VEIEPNHATLTAPAKAGIIKAVQELLDDETLHKRMSSPRTVYGDGEAGKRIAQILADQEYRPFGHI
jgi:UDP-N-acetylglucosamine 2-epimerase